MTFARLTSSYLSPGLSPPNLKFLRLSNFDQMESVGQTDRVQRLKLWRLLSVRVPGCQKLQMTI